MDQDDRLAALEARLQDLTDRQAIVQCAQQHNGSAEASLIWPILTCDIADGSLDAADFAVPEGVIDTSDFSIEFQTTTVVDCAIDGQSATAQSIRIGIYVSQFSDRRHVVGLRLEDVLKRAENGWEIVSRTAALEATLSANGWARGGRRGHAFKG
jgi:hypothetical protein